MSRLLFILFLLLTACGRYVEDRLSEDFEPIYLATTDEEQVKSDYGAIYKPNQSGLFAMESRAHRVGDILTVSFTESFQATKSQNAASSKSSDSTVTLPNILENLAGKDLIPESTDLSAGTEQSFTGSGSSNQSNSLTGLISVHVVRVFGNGNLEILGQKKLTLNNGDEYIRVSGIVRPRDISSDNVVPSDRIANADIDYIGAGDTAVSGKKGWYSKFLETVSPI
jgi:flagellar L-ring protein precursor FlgH